METITIQKQMKEITIRVILRQIGDKNNAVLAIVVTPYAISGWIKT